ncbi:MAG TPA: translation elongation factor Ts [Candidatus Hydrogenedentes bacterium]|nr:translation elongation factor Ts [Candidatus Hydrogenedentota bacterium]
MAITANDVKNLRESTGAGMMDCKRALTENNGDFDKAVVWLRERGMAKAAKRAGKVAAEGMIAHYIHMGGKIGVLVEVNCETDFVARGADFQTFAKDLCLQVCSANPRWVEPEDVPQEVLESEKQIYVKQALETGKPQNVCEKIADGKLKKWYEEVCLLKQVSVKPEHEGKTFEQLIAELTGKCGEKISVRRFVRWQVGEGIDKPVSNLAEEVAAELAKAEAKNA